MMMNTAEPLLDVGGDFVENAVDCAGRPVSRSASGGWRSAYFIIGVEIAERFSFNAIQANLITFLTGHLGQSTAAAAATVNVWSGVSLVLPILGAFVADSYIGRYWTIIGASLLYVLGLGLLTLFSVLPAFSNTNFSSSPPSLFKNIFFYFSLYIVAFAQGGHKPCLQAFGADQFDQDDQKESESRSSFFNWWFFAMCGGVLIALLIMSYIQDNLGWGLGFGIPCVTMVVALFTFLSGTKTYRYYRLKDSYLFSDIAKEITTFMTKRRLSWNKSSSISFKRGGEEEEDMFIHHLEQPNLSCSSYDSIPNEVDGDKWVLQVFSIWVTCLTYGIVYAQLATFFNKQSSTLDRRIGSSFEVPPAALQTFIKGSVLVILPIYDRLLVPFARRFSKLPSGITMLQRIGIGMVLSTVSMIIAALVEMKRLKTARDYGLVDKPALPIPMSLWWLTPQFIFYGVSEALTMVGIQEFFYDQVPDELRSLGIALYLNIFGMGSLISGLLVSVIDETTGRAGESWFSDNLNRAHLDYFYWLLAGLSCLDFFIYLYFAQSYVYKQKRKSIE